MPVLWKRGTKRVKVEVRRGRQVRRDPAPNVMKNCEPLQFLPVLPIDSTPRASCFSFSPSFSSLNFLPRTQGPASSKSVVSVMSGEPVAPPRVGGVVGSSHGGHSHVCWITTTHHIGSVASTLHPSLLL